MKQVPGGNIHGGSNPPIANQSIESSAFGRFFHARNGRKPRCCGRLTVANSYAERRERGIDMADTDTTANAQEPTNTDPTDPANGNEGGQGGFAPITTQEAFDKAVQARINRVNAKVAAEKARAENAEKELADLKNANQIRDWKEEVADETGVPVKLLRGSTKEEIKAHAEDIAASFKPDAAPVVESDGKQPGSPKNDPYADLANSLFGNND